MECKIRHDNANYKMPIEYEKDPGLFSLKIYHAGKFKYVDDKRKYVNGLVAYVDWCDIDKHGIRALGNDLDVRGLGRYIKNNKLIMVYCEHFETKLDTYASPPPTSTVVIEEMPSSTPVAKPTKTKRLLLEYTPTVNVEDQVVANENANETVDGIMQELLSMNYEFDPFRCEQEETRVVTNEPEETLVEGETVLDGEEDSGTEEDESDDEDYLFG
ncbi:hypothetical protein Tco_0835837 [Tanacetum coccineum]